MASGALLGGGSTGSGRGGVLAARVGLVTSALVFALDDAVLERCEVAAGLADIGRALEVEGTLDVFQRRKINPRSEVNQCVKQRGYR